MACFADGAIVGTALVGRLADAGLDGLQALTTELATAVHTRPVLIRVAGRARRTSAAGCRERLPGSDVPAKGRTDPAGPGAEGGRST